MHYMGNSQKVRLLCYSVMKLFFIRIFSSKLQMLKPDSIYNLQCPYDVMALLKQEQRFKVLENLKKELLDHRVLMESQEEKDDEFEKDFYALDENCILAGKPLIHFNLYDSTWISLDNNIEKNYATLSQAMLELANIRRRGTFLANSPEQHRSIKKTSDNNNNNNKNHNNNNNNNNNDNNNGDEGYKSGAEVVPDCSQYYHLDYSINSFEHLHSMKQRDNLTIPKESNLSELYPSFQDMNQLATYLDQQLRIDPASWLHYSMASYYWRMRGNASQAVECLRRALHLAPRQFRDIPLLSLANVLHQSHWPRDAAVVLHAALDANNYCGACHFTLGNVYAVLVEFNKSLTCYENAFRINESNKEAIARKNAILCHSKLELLLENKHRSLQKTLEDLKRYQEKHEVWQQHHRKLITEQAFMDERIKQRLFYDILSQQQQHQQRHSTSNEAAATAATAATGNSRDTQTSTSTSTGDMKTAANNNNLDDDKSGFAKQQQHFKITPNNNNNNKNIHDYTDLLQHRLHEINNEHNTIYKGLEIGQAHPFPWYPPVCSSSSSSPSADFPEGSKTYDHLSAVRDRAQLRVKLEDSAMKENIGPSWLLYNMAGLFWRVMGNPLNSIECIRYALHQAPNNFRDVSIVNLANVLYRIGRVKDAVKVMKDALAINKYEPNSLFFMGNLLAALGNVSGAINYYTECLTLDPTYQNALKNLRVMMCYQKFHQNRQTSLDRDDDNDSGAKNYKYAGGSSSSSSDGSDDSHLSSSSSSGGGSSGYRGNDIRKFWQNVKDQRKVHKWNLVEMCSQGSPMKKPIRLMNHHHHHHHYHQHLHQQHHHNHHDSCKVCGGGGGSPGSGGGGGPTFEQRICQGLKPHHYFEEVDEDEIARKMMGSCDFDPFVPHRHTPNSRSADGND
ncbi:hypothetical protein HELRODRAFT_193306 [Helobdella robusta]|uniref:Tetratricopeptide repeat protein 17 n=1 Tax=Helobdella robusta TaxID=6412 RepID=T1FUV2_HELRO|nr:hypothetical protein HELRODRAFT_193306 [Helobdella robusta]ESN97218.1 hypothetical protein HELRODRAFT_193306 [Helobdella robusta]